MIGWPQSNRGCWILQHSFFRPTTAKKTKLNLDFRLSFLGSEVGRGRAVFSEILTTAATRNRPQPSLLTVDFLSDLTDYEDVLPQ